MGTHPCQQRVGLASVGSTGYFLQWDNSSPSTLHLSLHVCLSVCLTLRGPILNIQPLHLDKGTPKYGGQVRTNNGLVGVWRTERCVSGEERMPGEERMLKAEELCNAARIHTELFGLPTSCQAGLGHKGLREWVREGEVWWRRKREIFGIF